MYKVINKKWENTSYDKKFYQNLTKINFQSTIASLEYPELDNNPQINTTIYFESENNGHWPPKEDSIWFDKRYLSKNINRYYFGLCKDNDFYKSDKTKIINLKERLFLEINFEINKKSQLVFVQDKDTKQINACIRIDLSDLYSQAIDIFKNNFNILSADDGFEHYFINLGGFKGTEIIDNLKNILTNIEFDNDGESPFIKVKNFNITSISDKINTDDDKMDKKSDKELEENIPGEIDNEPDLKKLKMNEAMINVLNYLKNGKSLDETLEILDIEIYRINSWLKLGKQNIEPYDIFYEQYNEIMSEKEENNQIEDNKNNESSQNNDAAKIQTSSEEQSNGVKTKKELIEESCILLEDGKTTAEICEILNIPESQMTNWYYLGKMNIDPYDMFYKAKENLEAKTKPEAENNENLEAEVNENLEAETKIKAEDTKKQDNEEKSENMKKISNLLSSELDIILESNNLDYVLFKDKDEKIDVIANKLSEEEKAKSLNLLEDIYSKRREILKKLYVLTKRDLLKLLSQKDYEKFSNKNKSSIINHIISNLDYNVFDEFLENLNKNIYTDIDTLNQNENDESYNGKNDSNNESEKYNTSFNDLDIQEDSSIGPDENEAKCVSCGKTLPKDYNKDKCKKCQRKEYVSKILKDMLSHIDPEVEFTMEDFKKIGYTDLRIKDYVWTLQEFDLINKIDEDKYSLKSQDILKQHIIPDSDSKNNDEKPEKQDDNPEKLSKTCSVCGKTFSTSHFHKSHTSEDGYEDYCKSCKKLVKAADYAEYLLRFVKPEQEFGIEDIHKNYPAREIMFGQIWSLQELGLINQSGDKYALVDDDTLSKFIDSYFQDNPDEKLKSKTDSKIRDSETQTQEELDSKEEPENEKQDKSETEEQKTITLITKKEFEKLDNKNKNKFRKMQILIDALKEGKDRKEAMNIAGVNISSIMAWNNLGQRGNELYVKFYNEYNKLVIDEDSVDNTSENTPNKIGTANSIQSEEEYKPKDLHYNRLVNEKMNIFLESLSKGESKTKAYYAANVTSSIVNAWIRSGEGGNERYVKFYDEYNKITGEKPKPESSNADSNEKHPYNYTQEKHEIIIDAIKEGKTRKQAANRAKISLYNLDKWYQKGRAGIKPFSRYYADYINARKYAEEEKSSKEKIGDKFFESEDVQNKLETFIEEIKNGKTRSNAAYTSELSLKDISNWIIKGNQGKEPYVSFAKEYKSARDYSISNEQNLKEGIQSEVLNLIKTGKTLKEASTLANDGKSEKDILYWYNNGRLGNNNNEEFYKQCLEASENNENDSFGDKIGKSISTHLNEKDENTESFEEDETFGFNYSQQTHNLVIDALKEGKSQEEAAEAAGISSDDLNNWFVNAHRKPYYSFYMDYISIKTNAFGENEDAELAENKDKIVIFFNSIRLGKNRKQAAKIADLNVRLINKWISKGNQGKEPYVSIANEYKEARQSATSLEFNFNQKLKNETMELIKNGKTLEEAVRIVNDGKNENDILNWYSAGKFGDKNHKDFYLQCEEFSSEKDKDSDDNAPELSGDKNPQNKDETPEESEMIKTEQEETTLKSFTINESDGNIEILIKGIVENKDLISTLSRLKGFDEYITKIVTNSIDNDKMDLLIEIKTTESKVNIIKKNLGILN